MAAKKAAPSVAPKKTAAAPAHGSYKEMIREAILALKDRKGSSRAALKKYVQANNKGIESGAKFDNHFNHAVKAGVDQGIFGQPKGTSGPIKLVKKEAAADKKPAAEKKPAADKKPATEKKPAAAKKTAAPKAPAASKGAAKGASKKAAPKTKAAAPKKATTAASKTKAVAKPKSNTGAKRTTKKTAAAPAVVDEKKILGKTSSGRVTKSKPATDKKPAAAKKAAAKKTGATPKKSATPKKADAAPAAVEA